VTDDKVPQDPITLTPQILYQTESITDAQNGSCKTIELVRKNQVLVQLTETAQAPATTNTELVYGKNTRLSKDKRTLLAIIDGYPKLSKKRSNKIAVLLVEVIPLVTLSKDKMEATLTLYPPVSGLPELDSTDLHQILIENKIHFGLSLEHLSSLLARCKKEKALLQNETVARGLLPLNGKDSFLRFAIEVGPLPGKLLGNGKIDFRERKMFVGVTKGQTIATHVPATQGTPGINVAGDEVSQAPGKDIPITVSDDAEYDKESGVIRAKHGGILSLVNENSIKVCAKQLIPGNIDYYTGNIESHDAVEIGGTILPDFKVSTNGDLLLGGNARSAIINCNGNLVIKGGIIGNKCRVKVKGDADLRFIEQGHLRAEGKVIIRKQAYYSKVMADKEILCEESSQIMAGILIGGRSLNLGNVGSPNAPPAMLIAGVAPERYLRYMKIREKLHDIEQERLLFLQRFGLQKKIPLRKSLEESIEALYQDMSKINLIPETSINRDGKGTEYLKEVSITVQKTVFSDTELQIGNITRTLKNDYTSVKFSLDPDQNNIIINNL
jgi:uncharacterized protein (DUF342 family)